TCRGLSAYARSGETDARHGTANVDVILSETNISASHLRPSYTIRTCRRVGVRAINVFRGCTGRHTYVLSTEPRKAKLAIKRNAIERPDHAIPEFCDIEPTEAETSSAHMAGSTP